MTLVGGVLLIGFLALTAYFSGQAKYQPLFAGLSPEDQATVVDGLNAAGIPSQVEASGSVSVPADKVATARMRLAQDDKLPTGGKGSDILGLLSSFSTPAQEREAIRLAQEAALSRSISTLDSVKSAIVHISPGKDSPFADETVAPSAVVNVHLASASLPALDESKAIARLVQYAVPGLQAKNVSVIDTSGRMLFDGAEESSPTTMGNRKLQAEIAEAKRRESELQRRLDVAFGPGNTIASIQVSLDMDTVSEQKYDFALGDKKVTEQATETMTDPKSSAIGTAGADGNPATPGAPRGPAYSSTVTSNQYPSTETRTERSKAVGELTAMTVSVIANATKVEDTAPLQAILDDYLGARNGQPGFSASVQSVPFDATADQDLKKAAAAASSSNMMGQVMSLLPVAALVIVGVLFSKSIVKAAMSSRASPPLASSRALDTGALPLSSNPALASRADMARSLANDPDIQAALKEAGLESVSDLGHFDDTVDVEEIRRRIDVPLEQIKKLARHRPETVAMLLKTWLLEERA
ncbi:MAG: hypothetical protein IT207_05795 [Fimbriimonadaceae bacterium]|nr:hypothetical protein [Fimbriimonadaceae bacterium]